MPSPKYTKIEITPEAYIALESETIRRNKALNRLAIRQSKTLNRLASELILKGVSQESLDFAQRALAVDETNKFDKKIKAKVIKDIGTSSIKINETLLRTGKWKLQKEGYLSTMLYVAQNTASMERDELHRILIICAYHEVPPSLAAEILVKLNDTDSQPSAKDSSRKEETWTMQTRPTSGILFTPHKH
jgi:hypothetical protein